jgi:hypothetical protein
MLVKMFHPSISCIMYMSNCHVKWHCDLFMLMRHRIKQILFICYKFLFFETNYMLLNSFSVLPTTYNYVEHFAFLHRGHFDFLFIFFGYPKIHKSLNMKNSQIQKSWNLNLKVSIYIRINNARCPEIFYPDGIANDVYCLYLCHALSFMYVMCSKILLCYFFLLLFIFNLIHSSSSHYSSTEVFGGI